jgi:hypothetical protein
MFAAVVYSMACAVHLITCDKIESDVLYYVSAGVFDGVALTILCVFARPSKFTDNLVYICIASLLINFYGLVIYELGWIETSYNVSARVLYIIAAFVLLKRDRKNDAILCGRVPFFYRLADKCNGSHNKIREEAKLQ